jgi:hypothetical protein
MNIEEKTVKAGWTGWRDSNVRMLCGIAPKEYAIVFIPFSEKTWETNTAILRKIIAIVTNGNV